MTFLYTMVAEHLSSLLYAFALLAGLLPDALALLRRRGSSFRGLRRSRSRRRRGGGLFGFLGALLLVFLVGGLVILLLAAFVVYRFVRGRRR